MHEPDPSAADRRVLLLAALYLALALLLAAAGGLARAMVLIGAAGASAALALRYMRLWAWHHRQRALAVVLGLVMALLGLAVVRLAIFWLGAVGLAPSGALILGLAPLVAGAQVLGAAVLFGLSSRADLRALGRLWRQDLALGPALGCAGLLLWTVGHGATDAALGMVFGVLILWRATAAVPLRPWRRDAGQDELRDALAGLPGVVDVAAVRLWHQGGRTHARAALRVAAPDWATAGALHQMAQHMIKDGFDADQVTLALTPAQG